MKHTAEELLGPFFLSEIFTVFNYSELSVARAESKTVMMGLNANESSAFFQVPTRQPFQIHMPRWNPLASSTARMSSSRGRSTTAGMHHQSPAHFTRPRTFTMLRVDLGIRRREVEAEVQLTVRVRSRREAITV